MNQLNAPTSQQKYINPFDSRNYSFREKLSYITNTNQPNNLTRLGTAITRLGRVIKLIFSFGICSTDITRAGCVCISRSRDRSIFQRKVLSILETNHKISGKGEKSIPINCPIINWSRDGSHAKYIYESYDKFAETLIEYEYNLDETNVNEIMCDISRDAYYIMRELVESDPSSSPETKKSHIENAVSQLRGKCGLLNNVKEYESALNAHLSQCAGDIHYRMLKNRATDPYYRRPVSYPCKHPCGTPVWT